MKPFEPQAKLFKTLMHPARLAILDVLRDGEQCVCHIEAHLGYRQAYISQQLMILREAGLIQDRRDGWNIFYRVIQPELYKIIDAATRLTGVGKWTHVDHNHACPCPKCNRTAEKAPAKIIGNC